MLCVLLRLGSRRELKKLNKKYYGKTVGHTIFYEKIVRKTLSFSSGKVNSSAHGCKEKLYIRATGT